MCAIVHAGLWAAFAALLTVTLPEQPRGLGTTTMYAAGRGLPVLLLAAVAITAATLAVLVLARTLPAAGPP